MSEIRKSATKALVQLANVCTFAPEMWHFDLTGSVNGIGFTLLALIHGIKRISIMRKVLAPGS